MALEQLRDSDIYALCERLCLVFGAGHSSGEIAQHWVMFWACSTRRLAGLRQAFSIYAILTTPEAIHILR